MLKVNTLTASLVAAGFLSVAGYAPVAKADTFNILQNSTSCSSGLNCNNSNSLIATITATQSGANVNIVYHIVDTSFWFVQAGNPPMVAWNTNPITTASATSLTGMANIPVAGS